MDSRVIWRLLVVKFSLTLADLVSVNGTDQSTREKRTVRPLLASFAVPLFETDLVSLNLAILTSFNRNFKARNDGNRLTMNFLASPDIVTAMAFSGKLSFDPTKDSLLDSQGNPFKFDPPQGDKLPEQGFTAGTPFPTPLLSK